MIPQLGASGTTFGTIFLFMTYIAYIFFGANLEDWSTFIFSIGSAIGAQSKATPCVHLPEDVFESTFFPFLLIVNAWMQRLRSHVLQNCMLVVRACISDVPCQALSSAQATSTNNFSSTPLLHTSGTTCSSSSSSSWSLTWW